MDENTAFKMAEGFGLGMGLMEVCGALTGAFMLAGCKQSKGCSHPGETKAQTYKLTKALAAAFEAVSYTHLDDELTRFRLARDMRRFYYHQLCVGIQRLFF